MKFYKVKGKKTGKILIKPEEEVNEAIASGDYTSLDFEEIKDNHFVTNKKTGIREYASPEDMYDAMQTGRYSISDFSPGAYIPKRPSEDASWQEHAEYNRARADVEKKLAEHARSGSKEKLVHEANAKALNARADQWSNRSSASPEFVANTWFPRRQESKQEGSGTVATAASTLADISAIPSRVIGGFGAGIMGGLFGPLATNKSYIKAPNMFGEAFKKYAEQPGTMFDDPTNLPLAFVPGGSAAKVLSKVPLGKAVVKAAPEFGPKLISAFTSEPARSAIKHGVLGAGQGLLSAADKNVYDYAPDVNMLDATVFGGAGGAAYGAGTGLLGMAFGQPSNLVKNLVGGADDIPVQDLNDILGYYPMRRVKTLKKKAESLAKKSDEAVADAVKDAKNETVSLEDVGVPTSDIEDVGTVTPYIIRDISDIGNIIRDIIRESVPSDNLMRQVRGFDRLGEPNGPDIPVAEANKAAKFVEDLFINSRRIQFDEAAREFEKEVGRKPDYRNLRDRGWFKDYDARVSSPEAVEYRQFSPLDEVAVNYMATKQEASLRPNKGFPYQEKVLRDVLEGSPVDMGRLDDAYDIWKKAQQYGALSGIKPKNVETGILGPQIAKVKSAMLGKQPGIPFYQASRLLGGLVDSYGRSFPKRLWETIPFDTVDNTRVNNPRPLISTQDKESR